MATTSNPALEQRVRPLISALQAAHGDGLQAVVVYGPGAESGGGRGPLTLLVVLADASAAALRRTAPEVGQLRRRGLEPLFMTRADIDNSVDVFPLEFLDMQAEYAVLHGGDPLAGLTFPKRPLRLQTEEELRGALHGLRQETARYGHRPQTMRRVLAESLASLVRVCRGLLAIDGQKVPADIDAVLTAAAERHGLDGDTVRDLRRLEQGGLRPDADATAALTDAYDRLLTGLIDLVDTLETD